MRLAWSLVQQGCPREWCSQTAPRHGIPRPSSASKYGTPLPVAGLSSVQVTAILALVIYGLGVLLSVTGRPIREVPGAGRRVVACDLKLLISLPAQRLWRLLQGLLRGVWRRLTAALVRATNAAS